ncbi:MAG TPA: 3-oxoacyl-[acyl-carrier-protein] reductase [bacterium]|nr:3-oxoacyl-[acyl-carrier-protein] reductase [bacterium]
MDLSLAGKKALITGAGSGIGREIAIRFSAVGAAVAVCDVVKEAADKVAAEITGAGRKAHAYAIDVSDFAAVQQLCEQIAADLGGIDILVNNAGITRDNLLLRMTEEEFDRVIAVNLKGAFNFTRACFRGMMKNRWGRIINIASIMGQMGNVGQANYAAAKAGIIGLTKSAAKELASRNVTVNAVAPGYIATAMTEKLDAATRETYIAGIPLKRAGTPEDVANVCLFLASELASYVTGQVLRIDGGLLM